MISVSMFLKWIMRISIKVSDNCGAGALIDSVRRLFLCDTPDKQPLCLHEWIFAGGGIMHNYDQYKIYNMHMKKYIKRKIIYTMTEK